MSWYVIRTKPHQERNAECQLRQRAIETFLPLLKRNSERRREVSIIEPLFPRYLFARFDLHHQYRTVNFARGVANIVEFGLKPAQVSDTLIDAMKGRQENGYITLPENGFRQGQVVCISSGPLAGLEAVFIREMKEQRRVLLLLRALGLHARLSLDRDHISLAHAL